MWMPWYPRLISVYPSQCLPACLQSHLRYHASNWIDLQHKGLISFFPAPSVPSNTLSSSFDIVNHLLQPRSFPLTSSLKNMNFLPLWMLQLIRANRSELKCRCAGGLHVLTIQLQLPWSESKGPVIVFACTLSRKLNKSCCCLSEKTFTDYIIDLLAGLLVRDL